MEGGRNATFDLLSDSKCFVLPYDCDNMNWGVDMRINVIQGSEELRTRVVEDVVESLEKTIGMLSELHQLAEVFSHGSPKIDTELVSLKTGGFYKLRLNFA